MDTLHSEHFKWTPPHCPNENCKSHFDLQSEWRYKRNGFFPRISDNRRFQRFTCKDCGVSFSSRTFRTDYWLKRRDILPQLMTLSAGGMANRQMADHLEVSPSTVDRQIQRLGRHCLLFHAEMMEKLEPPKRIVIDGLESFELSQYYPFHFHAAVAKESGFFLWFTDSPLRRKGRHTDSQKKRRAELEHIFGRPDPKAVRKDMQELLETVTRGGQGITIISDMHKSYPPAIRAIQAIVHHERISSKVLRDRNNKMCEINLLDGLIRHGQANHKRETWSWAKRRGMSALRLAIYLVWRNYVRVRWKKRCRATPAMEIGLLERRLRVADVLGQRLFIARAGLHGRWAEYYWGTVGTPALGVNRSHELKKAA